MPFATWWRGDPLPALPSLPTFSAHRSEDVPLLARLASLSPESISDRLEDGHRAYIAFLDDEPVACGWVARQQGGIAELHFSFTVPLKNGYLWDFLTLPQWRGRGVYPHLLQFIIQQESSIEYFWIGHAPGNDASARGISKAGFHFVSDLVITPDDQVAGLTLYEESERAWASAALFNLRVVR
jgi:GNAT superfamily N-acetyltransferase